MQALSERLNALLAGTTLLRVDLLGFSSLKTYAPTPDATLRHRLVSVYRRAKYLVWEFDDGIRFVLHLSQAGRLDVEQPPKLNRPRGSAVRFVFGRGDARVEGESLGVLVREYGTHRKASWWVLAPDEDGPMAGLGPDESARMVDMLRNLKQHHTTLLVEHDMEAVFALADRITVLVYGRVIATGTPDAIRSNAQVREAYLGEDENV